MKLNRRSSRLGKQAFLFILTSLFVSFGTSAQVANISITNPVGVNVCDTAAVSRIEIINITDTLLSSGEINISFPEGISYETSSLNEISQYNLVENTTDDLSDITLSLDDLPAGDTLVFEIGMLAQMEAIAFQDAGNVFRNQLQINFAEGSVNKTSNAYNLFYPVISITEVSPSSQSINSGESFTRHITIVNAGNGRVSSFFIKDSRNGDINITDLNIGLLNANNDTIKLSGNDFSGIGNLDNYFDSNESITISETITASGCQEGTITSTITNGWGCSSTILGSNNYAYVNVARKTPYLSVSTSSELSSCFGTGTASQHSITLTNTGQGLADAILLDIYKSLGNGYEENIFSRLETESIVYQLNGSEPINITPTETFATDNTGSYACLGSNPQGRAILNLPDMNAGDQIIVSFETYHCNINVCEG